MTRQEIRDRIELNVKKARELRDTGLSQAKIAEQLNIAAPQVSVYLKYGSGRAPSSRAKIESVNNRPGPLGKAAGKKCKCGNCAIDIFRGKPICHKCMCPEIDISLKYENIYQPGNLAQAMGFSHL